MEILQFCKFSKGGVFLGQALEPQKFLWVSMLGVTMNSVVTVTSQILQNYRNFYVSCITILNITENLMSLKIFKVTTLDMTVIM